MTSPAAALARAATAAQARRPDEALQQLLVAWRARPLAEIARVIEAAPSARVPVDIAGNRKAAKQAWLDQAATRQLRALPALLATLCDVSAPLAEQRLETLRAFAPDPRLDQALLALLADPPYTWYGSRAFWYAVLEMARAIRDERAPAQIVAAQGALERFGDKMRAPLARRLDATVATLTERSSTPPVPLDNDERADLATVAAAFAVASDRAAGRDDESADGAALLRAVFDDPDDDAARAVYADWLQQRGDPRGELVALQLRQRLSRADRTRISALLRDHRHQLLGPLAEVAKSKRLRFERGFVSRCVIDPDEVRLRGSPHWRTVRELEGGAPGLVCDPTLRALRSLVVYHPCLGEIAGVEPPAWRLVELRCNLLWAGHEVAHEPLGWRDDLRALARTERLPDLRVLAIRSGRFAVEPAGYGPLFDGPLSARLERLWLHTTTTSTYAGIAPAERSLGRWLDALRRFEPRVPLLELEDGYRGCPTVYRFARDADDSAYRLVSVVARYPKGHPVLEYAEQLCAALETLDGDDVAELDICFALAKADAPSRALIERTAKRFSRVTDVAIT